MKINELYVEIKLKPGLDGIEKKLDRISKKFDEIKEKEQEIKNRPMMHL